MAACIERRGIAFHIEPRSHDLFEAGTGGRKRGCRKRHRRHGQHIANLQRLIIGGAKHAAQVLSFGVVPTVIILPHECREQERELADSRQLIGSCRPRLAPVLQQCCRIIAFEAKAHGVPTIKAFNSYPVQEVASGSVVLAQCWNGNAKQAIDSSKNPNLVFVYPEPKSELWLDSYHIPTGAKSIKAAHSWINYVLDPEVAAREISYTGFLSPVTGTEKHLDTKVASDPLIFPPADAIKRGERTQRNETYDRRVGILTKFKAAAAQ